MNLYRSLLSMGMAGLVLVVCGGRVRQPKGYMDDAGVFRTDDGKVAYEAGSGCKGYDIAKFTSTPYPACGDHDGLNDTCEDWTKKRLPPGLPLLGVCNGGECAGGFEGVECDWQNQTSAAFCRSYYGQWVLGEGTLVTSCPPTCIHPVYDAGGASPPGCKPEDMHGWCTMLGGGEPSRTPQWVVNRKGVERLEPPCAPPPGGS